MLRIVLLAGADAFEREEGRLDEAGAASAASDTVPIIQHHLSVARQLQTAS